METGKRGQLREHVAGELRGHLAKKRISASEFARRVGWSQPYMARRYDGRVAMDLDDLEVIARELGISVTELLGGSGGQTTAAKLRLAESTTPPRKTPKAQPNVRTPHAVDPRNRRAARVPRSLAAAIGHLPTPQPLPVPGG